MSNTPRITDICKELNLSKATVSKALNGSSDISVSTREKVIAEARRIGSDYIVVGRPITAAEDPVAAYERCVREFFGE